MTDEVVTAYVEAVRNVVRSVYKKTPTVGVCFVSSPGQINLPKTETLAAISILGNGNSISPRSMSFHCGT